MHRGKIASPLFRYALGIVFLALFAYASSASVIYEYRELGSSAVIGTLEIMAPPASSDSGWSTADSSNLIKSSKLRLPLRLLSLPRPHTV